MALKYKAGDQVRIKSLDWYNKNIKNNGIIICGSESFTHPMSHFCDKVVTIVTIQDDCYRILEDDGDWYWTDEMIEGLVEEETLIERVDDNRLPFNEWLSYKGAFYIPDDYVLKDENGNVINATKIVLEKKKKEYPKTFRECQKYLGEDVPPMEEPVSKTHRRRQVHLLEVLLICRDAYWKIAGEEMGLGKPWEPDWSIRGYYAIAKSYGKVIKTSNYNIDCTFVFPTEEMRDAFYENFKELIESCKELL